jgi:hypothetical protein
MRPQEVAPAVPRWLPVATGWVGQVVDYAECLRWCCRCRSRSAARLSLRRWVSDRLMASRGAGCGVPLTWMIQSPRAAVSKALSRGTSWIGIRKLPTQRSSCHTLSTSRSCSGCQVTRKPASRWSMKTSRRVGRARRFLTTQAWALAGRQARPARWAALVVAVLLPGEQLDGWPPRWSGAETGLACGAARGNPAPARGPAGCLLDGLPPGRHPRQGRCGTRCAPFLASLRDRLRRPLTRPSSRRPGATGRPGRARSSARPAGRRRGPWRTTKGPPPPRHLLTHQPRKEEQSPTGPPRPSS